MLRRVFPLLFGKLQMNEAGDEPLLSAIVQVPGNALASHVGSGNQASSRRHQLLLGMLSLGDITNVDGENRLVAQPSTHRRYLGGKLAAVGTHRGCLDSPVEKALLPGRNGPSETLVRLATCTWPNRFREFSTCYVGSPVAEDVLESTVDVHHAALPVNINDRVVRCFEDPGQARDSGLELGVPRRGLPKVGLLS